MLKAVKNDNISSNPSATDKGASASVDRIDLSRFAKLAVEGSKAEHPPLETPSVALILDKEGKQIGRILEGGGISFNGEDLLRQLGGPTPDEAAARAQELAEKLQQHLARQDKTATQPTMPADFDRADEYIFGAKFAKFNHELSKATSEKDAVQALMSVVNRHLGDAVTIRL